MSRLAFAIILAAVAGCNGFGAAPSYPTPADLERPAGELDLSGIERNGPQTDVIADYWSSAFSSLGRDDTFRLFARKYDLLAKKDPDEADAALDSFRRLCRLRGSLSAFEGFWGVPRP